MKKILTSLSIIGLVAMAAIGATMAFFKSSVISNGNTFSAGTIGLEIRDNDESWGNGVTATWKASNLKPGNQYDFTVPLIGLRSTGSLTANHLEITDNYTVAEEFPRAISDTDPDTDLHPDAMAKKMVIARCKYYDSVLIDCLTDLNPDYRINDMDSDGKITFYDLKQKPLDNILPPGSTYAYGNFEMGVKFDESAGNDLQGDQFRLDMIFTLNQDASQ